MSPATVLHVEDDPNDVLLFEHACRHAGVALKLQAVEDGDQAIAYLRGEGKFHDRRRFPFPALVLLDLQMPGVTGLELIEQVRHEEAFRKLPIVVLTSS